MVSCRRCGEPISFDDEVVSDRTGARIPLEWNTTEPHNCPESEYYYESRPPISCTYCKAAIAFDDDFVSKFSGKKIPLDPETEPKRPHDCEERRRATSKTPCRNCGKRIYFDPNYTSVNGKLIPMSVEDGAKHRCPRE